MVIHNSDSYSYNALEGRVLRQALRESLKAFVQKAFLSLYGFPMDWNWHHDVICDALVREYTGGRCRLIINVPPRSLKSFICSVAYPAWVMGQNPRMKIIGVSYSQELSTKFCREQRTLMQMPWYKKTFPGTRINPKKAGETEFETTAGGFRLATSTGGTLTGRGGDLIIVDDPIKPQDALSETVRNNANHWLDNTLMTRLDDKQTGKMVMIMQRLHEHDSTGHLLEKGGWTHHSLPAIAQEDEEWMLRNGVIIARKAGELLHPNREPQNVLDDLRRDLGKINFSAQYLQLPLPLAGNLMKREWLRYYDTAPLHLPFRTVISIDTSMKEGAHNDWTVITVWHKTGDTFYLLHVHRERLSFPRLHAVLSTLQKQYQPRKILIEDTGAGTSLLQQLKEERISCIGIKPHGDKVERMQAASIAFEQGNVLFPKSAPWLDELEREILGFPSTRHDDQVDSVSQFLNWALTDGRRMGCGGRFSFAR